jgi:glyoxylase I family protein
MIEVTQALHVAVNVSDLQTAEYFYGQILGLEKVDRNLKFPGAWYQVGSFQVHLIPAPQIIDDRTDEAKWGRNRHLAFSVANLEAAHQRLTAEGYPIQASASGRAALFTHDPDGNIIELSENLPDAAITS